MLIHFILKLIYCHNSERSHFDENDASAHEITGCYPGEGHEAMHALACGDCGEGQSFHEHESRYGALHEINGEFFDGHSRLEHQEMYKFNGGLNEHANVQGAGAAGINDFHFAKLGGAYDGAYGGGSGWGIGGGSDWANGVGCGPSGWCGGLGAEAHGAMGFAHGDGDYHNGGRAGGRGAGGWGLGGGWGGAGWGGAGGWGRAGGWGGIYGEHGGAYGKTNGRDMLDEGLALTHGVERNHAVFAPNGLLTPARGEISLGGAVHSTIDGVGHGNARFYNGSEHALYHNLLGQNTPANVVDFYEDVGVLDPVTGEFVGGYMHPGTFSGVSRQNHKALEIARNIANGNGFRKVLIGENPFERMHGHYGQGSSPFEGASSHSALRAAANGILTSFDGTKTADLLYQQEKNIKLAQRMTNLNHEIYRLNGQGWNYDPRSGRYVLADNQKTVNNLSEYDRLRLEALRHFQAAQISIAQGNMGRAVEHMKEGQLKGLEAKTIAIDQLAMINLEKSRKAAKHGDGLAANAFRSAAVCMHENAHLSAESYANSIGITNHHHDESVLFGGERHAAIAREKALKAEKLRQGSAIALSAGDINTSNAMIAAAAVTGASGRVENELGRKLTKLTEKNKMTVRMDALENVQNQYVKEAIAHQDNMHKITTGNDAPFNISVTETIEDMNLKHLSGVHNRAKEIAGAVLAQIPSNEFIEAINTANIVSKNLAPPPIRAALVIANADEIANSMVCSEERRLRIEQAQIAAKLALQETVVQHIAETPIETLGITGSIPEDADSINIVNAVIQLPFKGFDYMVARTEEEKEALEAQSRLRDDIRGKVTKRKFDSPLNVIKAGDGWLNIPESAVNIEIEDGRAFFNADAKAKMIRAGLNTDFLAHIINTGERKDMAAGIGYFVADLSGLTIDLPSADNPIPVSMAYGKGKFISLTDAIGIDVLKGMVSLIPWKEFKKNMRPKVNTAIKIKFPSKEERLEKEKEKKVEKEAEKIIEKDDQMLQNVSLTKKKIIVNPDGSGYIELKPAYGVKELVRVEDAKNVIPSNYVRGERALDFGQPGVSEIKGETEEKSQKQECKIKNVAMACLPTEFEVGRLGLTSAIVDKDTNFVINKQNAFDKKIIGHKQKLIEKNIAGKINTEVQIIEDKENSTLMDNKDKKRSVFERAETKKDIEEENRRRLVTIEEMEMKGHFFYEKKLREFKKEVSDVYRMNDIALIQTIEKYIGKSIEEMHEFDFMFCVYNFYQSRNVLLEKVKKFGLDYLEWRNMLKKYLKTNIVLAKNLEMDKRQIFMLVNKITDQMLNDLRAYHTLPCKSEECAKEIILKKYEKTVSEIRLIFSQKADTILDFLKTEISNFEHLSSTEGGNACYCDKLIFMAKEKHEEITHTKDACDRDVTVKAISDVYAPVEAKTIKRIVNDKNGKKRQVLLMETDEKECENPVVKKIIHYNKKEKCNENNGNEINDMIVQKPNYLSTQKVCLSANDIEAAEFEAKKKKETCKCLVNNEELEKKTQIAQEELRNYNNERLIIDKETKDKTTIFKAFNVKPEGRKVNAEENNLSPFYVGKAICNCE
ncbi:hypothetical protein GVAV_002225 [Gurleya vavrai]